METLVILLFCLAIGYVCVWVLVNERHGNVNGDWGFIAMRVPAEKEGPASRAANETRGPYGTKS